MGVLASNHRQQRAQPRAPLLILAPLHPARPATLTRDLALTLTPPRRNRPLTPALTLTPPRSCISPSPPQTDPDQCSSPVQPAGTPSPAGEFFLPRSDRWNTSLWRPAHPSKRRIPEPTLEPNPGNGSDRGQCICRFPPQCSVAPTSKHGRAGQRQPASWAGSPATGWPKRRIQCCVGRQLVFRGRNRRSSWRLSIRAEYK
jgi:hypothetical protein